MKLSRVKKIIKQSAFNFFNKKSLLSNNAFVICEDNYLNEKQDFIAKEIYFKENTKEICILAVNYESN